MRRINLLSHEELHYRTQVKSEIWQQSGVYRLGKSPMDDQRRRYYAALLWVFTLLFAARVAGQAIQYWSPIAILPEFEYFQGSNLGYGLLLPIQIAILLLMGWFAGKVKNASLVRRARHGLIMLWIGWIYMTGSIARILIGLVVVDAHPWFSTWIPAFFHLVLAGYLLTLAYYHLAFSNSSEGGKSS